MEDFSNEFKTEFLARIGRLRTLADVKDGIGIVCNMIIALASLLSVVLAFYALKVARSKSSCTDEQ